MKEKEFESLVNLFKVLGNPIRLKILLHIAGCCNHSHKHNISHLSENCNVDFSVVSRHLKALKDAGILKASKDKNDVIYELEREKSRAILLKFSENF